ncbi:helix-turn-helix domain-containing protein [Sorangium sp. So ce362]|uniref:helix-turn-helix domain-containing protein n=1 Tax=Sorangium sp. So ce362 TaxID=3133303 RepID=UPI003F612CE6
MRHVANENAVRDTGAEFYDAKSCPMAPTTFRRAAATGAFPSFKIGRKLMARKADVDAWIATQARTPKPKAQSGDDVDGAFFASLQPRRPSR